MKTWRISPSAILALAILAGGCGGRARTAPPPSTDVTRTGADAKPGTGEKRGPTEDTSIRLPGQDRSYPSEDPRNRPRSDAPALAPVPSGTPAQGGTAVGDSRPSGADGMLLEIASPQEPDFGPPPVPRGEVRFRVQILASAILKTALAAREEVAKSIEEPVFVEREQEIWKVRVGDLADRAAADGVRRRLVGLGYDDAFVVEARGR